MPGTDRRPRRGFVLPTTILVVTLLTVMLAAAFILVSADYRTTLNAFATARSLALAQAGMQTYFSVPHVFTGTDDSATYTFGGGYARVRAQRLRDTSTTQLTQMWVVRSIGYDTLRALSGQPNGQRAVAQLATLTTVSLPSRAAMVAPNGVQILGAGSPQAAFSGTDLGSQCTCASPGTGSNALSVTRGLLYSPTPLPTPTESIATRSAALDSTHIDWASLLAGNFTPDSTLTPGSTAGWPAGGSCTYQTWYVPGDAVIPAIPGGPYGNGIRGLLVVKGNVTVSDGAHWDGVIVAGGRLKGATSSANYLIHGMVVTGLSLLSPGTDPGPDSVSTTAAMAAGYAAHIQWTWCYTKGAIGSLSYLVPIKNSWVDTWSTY